MYAVINAGGRQQTVETGQVINVDRFDAAEGAEVSFRPVLVVDGATVLATPEQLGGASVTATVVGATKGPKIRGFTYKNKSNQRRRFGHRQHYTAVEITGITKG
jgi:large subunit ribosomal protein L21